MIDINRRRLKLAPYPQAVDLIFVQPRQVGISPKLNPAAVRLGAASNEVHHSAFARAVRSNDDAEFAFIHVKIQVRNGFETVESLVDSFQHQDKLFAAHAHLVLTSSVLES